MANAKVVHKLHCSCEKGYYHVQKAETSGLIPLIGEYKMYSMGCEKVSNITKILDSLANFIIDVIPGRNFTR